IQESKLLRHGPPVETGDDPRLHRAGAGRLLHPRLGTTERDDARDRGAGMVRLRREDSQSEPDLQRRVRLGASDSAGTQSCRAMSSKAYYLIKQDEPGI